MPIKKYKPMTPGRRGMTTLAKDEITTSKPEKSLLAPLKSKVEETTQDVLLHVTKVLVTKELTVSSISNVTKTTCLHVLLQSNTIQTVQQTLHC